MQPLKPIKKFSIRINGDSWKVELYSKASFDKLHPDCTAITIYTHLHRGSERVIRFHVADRTRDSIAHEVIHAYASYHDFSQMSYGAIEEHFAEMLGKRYRTLYRTVDRIAKKLRR